MPLFYRDLHLRALEAAYHRHYDQLCAVAAAVLGGDAALAQDAVQEAWLRLNAPGVRERIRTDDADRLRGLLLVTVRNAARNLRRAAPAARELTLPNGQSVILMDTVGLIQRLPHQLVEAFHSTLEVAADADLILLVCDYGSPDRERQLDVAKKLLDELGCGEIPMITVCNKIDKLDNPAPESNSRTVFISAKDPETLPPLLHAIEEALASRICTLDLLLPYSEGSLLHLIREKGQVLSESYEPDGIRVKASINRQYKKALSSYQIKE